MAGDFVIGLIVFLILIVVNFVVITQGRDPYRGSRRPLHPRRHSRQADVDRRRSVGGPHQRKGSTVARRELEEESSFFGSMDGASKFRARRRDCRPHHHRHQHCRRHRDRLFAPRACRWRNRPTSSIKLSVGDGLVTQIPGAHCIAGGRSAGLQGRHARLGRQGGFFGQLGGYPRALVVAALLLFVLALMPGLPALPFLFLGGGCDGDGRLSDPRCAVGGKPRAPRPVETEKERSKEEEEKNSLKNSLATAEIELLIGKQLSTRLLTSHQELAFRMGKNAQEVRAAIRLRWFRT